ncbi:MAG TPA: sulfotransferase [Mycobacteriales bacterium]|nr:sulfotransferase [Mycobacteriales bacterium]
MRTVAKTAFREWGVATASLRQLPDFLIIGTKRGGTTSLWNYLLTHPHILPMFPAAQNLKSPHYFYWHYDRSERWYRSHFATRLRRTQLARVGKTAPVTGEASPYYLYSPYAAERARALLPQAKIIIMLRDPVARAYSHYWERVHEGVEPLSFDAALAAEDDRLAGEADRMAADPLYYSRPHDFYTYRDRGVYLPQLERWLGQYPSEQVLIVQSEAFYADKQAIFDQVTDFLGLPGHQLGEVKRFNYRPAEPMSEPSREFLTDFFVPHNRALYDYLGRDFAW